MMNLPLSTYFFIISSHLKKKKKNQHANFYSLIFLFAYEQWIMKTNLVLEIL